MPVFTETRSDKGEKLDALKSKWKKIAFTDEFSVENIAQYGLSECLAPAWVTIPLTAVKVFDHLHRVQANRLDPRKSTYVGHVTVHHYRKIGDISRGFRKGKWIGTHNGVIFYMAQGERPAPPPGRPKKRTGPPSVATQRPFSEQLLVS